MDLEHTMIYDFMHFGKEKGQGLNFNVPSNLNYISKLLTVKWFSFLIL